jgi:hypothetical protein
MGDTTADSQDDLQVGQIQAILIPVIDPKNISPIIKKIGCTLPIFKLIIDAKINSVL